MVFIYMISDSLKIQSLKKKTEKYLTSRARLLIKEEMKFVLVIILIFKIISLSYTFIENTCKENYCICGIKEYRSHVSPLVLV